MRLFGKSKPEKKVLFVCVENAGRSQMAEGFFRKYAPKDYEAISGGTSPRGMLNPLAVQVMKEIGIDISSQKAKGISDEMIRRSNQAINMGCMDKSICPSAIIPKMTDWDIEDPKDKPIERVREIRDQIEQNVKEFVSSLE